MQMAARDCERLQMPGKKELSRYRRCPKWQWRPKWSGAFKMAMAATASMAYGFYGLWLLWLLIDVKRCTNVRMTDGETDTQTDN